ncbi:MAG TPA: NAD(P)-dependent oxidoreductase, partial [Blastocatellia bacterium]|nr:NAD(P)-dependent oxidoreductase [Blastocatellia bacterium]
MTYKIWYNGSYPEAELNLLKSLTSGHELIFDSDYDKEESAKLLSNADIAFGQPNPDIVRQSSTLKLIHLSSAGYDKFDNAEMREALTSRGAAMTNSSQVYNEPCAQHALAMILSLARRIPEALDVQRTTREWPTWELRAISPLLCGQTILMLSFGAIAQRLAELLSPFRANLIALRRRKVEHDTVKVITEDELSKYLPLADHVVNILPSNAGTTKFINTEKLALMKQGANFYNIGRGSTVDQEALLDALN